MASEKPQVPKQRAPRIVRIVKLRPRLFIAAAVGLAAIAVLFLLCPDWRTPTST